ncbi:MAG: hypothetical protein EA413_05665 [Cyanobium sp. PLM2.Bin73]|nr:MAG: hypothetical protein EA413_05665 [Cyanobium sp. PLM2.Bin73]
MRFLKRGRSGRLLDQLCRWSPQSGWAPGHAPSARVPQVLRQRIEAELQRRHRRRGASSAAAATQAQVHRSSIPGVSEAISCGRMSVPAFLAMG